MTLSMRYLGDPVLRQKAKRVEAITPEVKALAEQMIEKMMEHNGVGLAAPQVGKLVRLFIICEEIKQEDGSYTLTDPEVIINPELTSPSEELVSKAEGCLSIPGIYADVERPYKIHLRYQKLDGTVVEEDPEGFRARVIMHENDHLNGVLFIDRLSLAEKKKLEPALQKIRKQSRK